VRLNPPAVKKDDPNIWLDLSAIAEGYAVDRVAKALAEAGVAAFMVELGGEIAVHGSKANGDPWRVGVVFPSDGLVTYREVAALTEQALATSGDYRNFNIIDGQRYSHAIDPTTGWPVDHGLASATVVAPDCITADAVATSVMVLGLEKGREMCARLNLPLLTYQRAANGESLSMWRSPDFPLAAAVVPPKTDSGISVFIATALIFGLAIAAMAIGVIFGKRRIMGSCGGMANMRDAHGNIACSMCTRPQEECKDVKRWTEEDQSALADEAIDDDE
jgi:thiamine biosynthesis lipoprotein